jgi:hypothetical protein
LALFVFWVGADYPDHATAMNDLAFVANLFYRCSYFHDNALLAHPRKTAGLKPGLYKTFRTRRPMALRYKNYL